MRIMYWSSDVCSSDLDGKINRRLGEIATIAHLRNKLRSGDVWVERSAGYRRFDSYLRSEPQAKPIVSALGLPPTAGEWLEQRGRELDWRLKKFAQRLKRDALAGVRYRDDRLQISPVRTIATPDAEALADRLDAMTPRKLGRASGRERGCPYVWHSGAA